MLNLPNLLSGFRLAAAPVLVGLALGGARGAFAGLLTVALLSDALDGWIARRWNLRTEFGARLDSAADTATYVAALVGVFAFEAAALAPHLPALYAFIAFLALSTLAPVLKFGRPGAYHLTLFKLTAVVQTVAILWLFYVDFNVPLFYLAMAVGILACLEDLAVTLLLEAPVADARSFFALLRQRRR